MSDNNIFVVKAVDLTHDGLGVTKLEDGYTVFVEDLLKGEAAKIEVIERKKSYGFGKVIERLNRSPYRQAPKCKHFYECGGCELMHMDYDVQAAFKKYRLELMAKKLKQADIIIEDIITMVNPYHYRNKIEIKFSQEDKGIKAGFFKAKSHHVVNLQECHIMQKKSFELLNLIRNLANQYGIKAFNSLDNTGVLKSAVIRESSKYKEISVLFNIATDEIPNEVEFVESIVKNLPEVVGIGISKTIDESPFSDEEIRLVHGRDYIKDEILGKQFEIGFRSFFQVNTLQAERLYKKVIEFARFTGNERVIDAYSGIGSIAISISDKVNKVFGVEIVKSAVNDAKRNARLNGVKNALFELGNIDKVLEKWKGFNFDVIIVDPPRKGCSKELLNTIVKMKFPKVVYISCNPATLARDLDYLLDNNYSINRIAPVDMFPQTSHVESVTLLSIK
ncbi:MAG: 23S rRNA (uracil(1939)-C(5))-methyltransferase RlmD [Tenericutes bacterium HGW-Tenericutes-5]|jgi:23S rRNA (uracil1939-C5)-methyltransferase|nr:MAG: 23S rRNA (uracil(1939)-C(5))-methyltransferase RlmD [Tenericutes bacterium HGW-Tenericutes-5]